MEPTQAFTADVPMHSARTVQEAIEAHRELGHCSNRVFADASGNIGYLLSGRLPKRPGGPAHVPVPGWTGEHEWEGWVPFEEMPRSVNPPSHFINTSNNLIVRPDYPHYVSAGPFLADARAQRVASGSHFIYITRRREVFAHIERFVQSLTTETGEPQ